jgi:hypothetical protein
MATTVSRTRPTLTLTEPSSLTQHIVGSLTTVFTPHSDCYLANIGPAYTSLASTEIHCEIFPGFWCIPPTYSSGSLGTPWYSRCYPETTESSDQTFRHFVGPYSPGFRCLDGWTTAMRMEPGTSTGHIYLISDRTLTPKSYFSFLYPSSTLLSGETGAVCYPS